MHNEQTAAHEADRPGVHVTSHLSDGYSLNSGLMCRDALAQMFGLTFTQEICLETCCTQG